jgi:acetoacetate decarboxylase
LAELIEVPPDGAPIDAWIGPGSLQFNSVSELDPWHKLRVKKLLLAVYRHSNMVLHPGKVVKRY